MKTNDFNQLQFFNPDYSITPYRIRIVSDALGLSGQNVEFLNEDFYGLKVGEKVIQIGDGRENGTIRTDKFNYPVEYCGAINLQFNEIEKMYAFRLPDKMEDSDIFLLYGNTGLEIFTENVLSRKARHNGKLSIYMKFFVPVFTKVNVHA